MGDKDFLRLKADGNFKKLSAAHQALLLAEFCARGFPREARDAPEKVQQTQTQDTPSVRESDAIEICDSLVLVDESVRTTFLEKLAEDPRRSPRLIGMTGTSTWLKPRVTTNPETFADAPASGADVARCQRRLIQVFSLLRDQELSARSTDRKRLLTNTIEWFISLNLPIVFGVAKDASLLGLYDRDAHRMLLFHDSVLKISPDGIGDVRETLKKLAHEVNHACRRHEDTKPEPTQFVDEVFAYVTELLVAGNVITEKQMTSTFSALEKPPYNLKKASDSPEGKSYKAAIKYHDPPGATEDSNPVRFPLPAPGLPKHGWNHTNATGL